MAPLMMMASVMVMRKNALGVRKVRRYKKLRATSRAAIGLNGRMHHGTKAKIEARGLYGGGALYECYKTYLSFLKSQFPAGGLLVVA